VGVRGRWGCEREGEEAKGGAIKKGDEWREKPLSRLFTKSSQII